MKKIAILLFLSAIALLARSANPHISFFIELKGPEFSRLFDDSLLMRDLKQMHASLRIGLIDFSKERTETIQKLNRAGIPVYAWLLLPEDEGYWFYMNNGDKAVKRYAEFKKWTAENQLKWAGLGIDLELDFNDARMAVKHPVRLAWKAYRRLFDNTSIVKGREIYQGLINQMIADSFKVESYVIPVIYDERLKHTTSLQKLSGILDVQTPVEIPMDYTSAMGAGSITVYHNDHQPIALGITGGGVNIEGVQPKFMTWDDLSRDLLVANQYTNEIIIFCLEATVENGWLPKIMNFNYNQPVPDVSALVKQQEKSGMTIQTFLVILDHPILATLGVLIVVCLLIYLIYRFIRAIIRRLSGQRR